MGNSYTVAEITSVISLTRAAADKTADEECARLPGEIVKVANKKGFYGQATVTMTVGKFENFTALHKYVCELAGINPNKRFDTTHISYHELKDLKMIVDKVIDHFSKSEDWFIEYATEHFPTYSGKNYKPEAYDETYKDNCVELVIFIDEMLKLMDEDPSARLEYTSY